MSVQKVSRPMAFAPSHFSCRGCILYQLCGRCGRIQRFKGVQTSLCRSRYLHPGPVYVHSGHAMGPCEIHSCYIYLDSGRHCCASKCYRRNSGRRSLHPLISFRKVIHIKECLTSESVISDNLCIGYTGIGETYETWGRIANPIDYRRCLFLARISPFIFIGSHRVGDGGARHRQVYARLCCRSYDRIRFVFNFRLLCPVRRQTEQLSGRQR
jgi:hypothetical protein